MNENEPNERLTQYLSQRSDAIEVGAGNIGTVTARASRRRRSRRAAIGGAVVAVLVIAGVAFFGRSPAPQSVNAAAGPATPEVQAPTRGPLTWTSVDVNAGLGWSPIAAAAIDGSLFDLSTAPGPIAPETPYDGPKTLYRSTDGHEWSAAALPDGFSPTGLAGSGGAIYAVGTAPAGGGTGDLSLVSSADGAHTWSTVAIPQPAAEARATHPNEVRISNAVLALGPTGLVAAVTVSAEPDVASLLATTGVDTSAGWRVTATGVDVYDSTQTSCFHPVPQDKSGTALAVSSDGSVASVQYCAATPTVAKSYTWDELGLDPVLRPLVGGELHLYTSHDGTSFDEVAATGMHGHLAALIGSPDGYRTLVDGTDNPNELVSYSSPDGTTWTKGDSTFGGYVEAAGVLRGKPAVLLLNGASPTLLTGTSGGGWSSADIGQAMGVPAGGVGVIGAAIGPLGIAMAVQSGATTYLVESPEGIQFNARDLQDVAGPGNWSVAGVTMNADAVVVRFLSPNTGSSTDAPGPQKLAIGTPT